MTHFRIYYFWEEKPTPRPINDYIVSQTSAAPVHDNTERAGIAADHSGMVKFEDPSCQGFRLVMDALLRYSDEAIKRRTSRGDYAAGMLGMERYRELEELQREIRVPNCYPFTAPGTMSRSLTDETLKRR